MSRGSLRYSLAILGCLALCNIQANSTSSLLFAKSTDTSQSELPQKISFKRFVFLTTISSVVGITTMALSSNTRAPEIVVQGLGMASIVAVTYALSKKEEQDYVTQFAGTALGFFIVKSLEDLGKKIFNKPA